MDCVVKNKKALGLYRRFHQFEPHKVGEFAKGFSIPTEVHHVGQAKTMFYTSDKLNPETHDDEGWISYYHEHKPGVKFCVVRPETDSDLISVPSRICTVDALIRLGDCEGFEYEDFNGKIVKAESTGRPPEWYTTPSGKALLIVQDKRTVVAVLWGGQLHVEARGVVG